MIEYITRHPEKVIGPLTEHIWLVLVTLVISLAIASILTVIAMRSEKVSDLLNNFFSLMYSVPSLALFALLIPITGLGRTSAVIVLTLYNQYLLLRNFTTGLREADPVACEAAMGIGMTDMQILFEGLRTMNIPKILWGSVLSAGMAVLLNAVMKVVAERM